MTTKYIDAVASDAYKQGILTTQQAMALTACIRFTNAAIKTNNTLKEAYTRAYGTKALEGLKSLLDDF